MKSFKIILFAACTTFLLIACTNNTPKTETVSAPQKDTLVYQCPMDCENGKKYDKPGKCPVCEMDLEKK